jgi:hypothetical protein
MLILKLFADVIGPVLIISGWALAVFGGLTLLMITERIGEAEEGDKKDRNLLAAFILGGLVNCTVLDVVDPKKWAYGIFFTLVMVGAWGMVNGIGDEIGRKYPSA